MPSKGMPAEWHREWRRTHKKECEISRIKYRYDLFPSEAEKLYERASGSCDVCGGTNGGKRLNIDHCHLERRVRGVLCHACNIVLGLVKDDTRRLRQLAEYLDAGKKS
jgi:hypothetical protein